MGGKNGLIEGLERISRDWAKNFSKSWTQKELEESAEKFNQTKDFNSRHNFFYRFLNAKHIRYVDIEKIGSFLTDSTFERRLPGDFMLGDSRKTKVGITGLSVVILEKEFVRYGCNCTIPHAIWVEKKKIPLSEIKGVLIKGDTLLVTF